MTDWLALLPGYRALARRLETEYNERTRQLQVDHGVDLARADALEQELERVQAQNDTVTTLKANFAQENVRLQGLLADTRKQRDELNRENEKLHAQFKLLVDTLNKQVGGKVDEAPQDTVATNVTQDSTQVRPVRNARHRSGAARKEP